MLLTKALRQRLALFYIYLLSSAYATEVVNVARSNSAYSFFGPQTRVEYDSTGEAVPNDITKSPDHIPRIEVSNRLYSPTTGGWHTVRSLGGKMAVNWMQLHADGHPNTTVTWAHNGTNVHPHECHALLHVHQVHKRWGWEDKAIELTLWGTNAFTVTNAGLVAGFAGLVLTGLIGFAGYLLAGGKSSGSKTITDNNKRSVSPSLMHKRKHNWEKNVYYHQAVTNQDDTHKWPSKNDMGNAIHSALQDMTDHDYQGACYDAVTNEPVFGPGEGCPIKEFGQLGFCSWMDGGKCTTPKCQLALGEYTQCSGSRASDGQFGK